MTDAAQEGPLPSPERESRDVGYPARFLNVTLALMVVLAAIRLPYEFWRLLFDPASKGAIDLRIISTFVTDWFAGQPQVGTYPPASYVLLWPFLGWLSLPQLRWAWAVSGVVLLGWLILRLERSAGLETTLERAWFRLFVLSSYATVVVIGNGQLAIHLLPALLAGILLLYGPDRSAGRELGALVLLLVAMIKPSLSVPFFWVALFGCGAYRVVIGAVVAYVGLTAAGLSVRPEAPRVLIQRWLATATDLELGYAHLQHWSRLLGLADYGVYLSLALLGALGIWVFVRRRADLWVLLGVAAITARFWTYHQLYDDMLLFIPVVALLRIRRRERARERGLQGIADLLIAACWLGLMGPGTLLRADHPLGTAYRAVQALVWVAMAAFLVYWAEKEPTGGPAPRRLHDHSRRTGSHLQADPPAPGGERA